MSLSSLSSEDESESPISTLSRSLGVNGNKPSNLPTTHPPRTASGQAGDSDVDMINVEQSTRQPSGPRTDRSSTHQSLVHFDGAVREPHSPQEYDLKDDASSGLALPKRYYDDFHTIDWVRDRNRDRIRHKRLVKNKKLSWRGWAKRFWDAASGWMLVFLVGVSSGMLAGIVDVAAEWMSDLKEGYCPHAGFYNRESCCWNTNETNMDAEETHCQLWKEWNDIANLPSKTAGAYALNYVIYVMFAIVFAGLAGVYVTTLAPYAAGSGIPEVKTILSGFIIRGYLGATTLLVKTVSMVLAVGAGLSLGKEGPLVHVACCAGNLFTRVFPKYYKNEAKKREVLSAAAAAGVSVAFGAPVGGVLFSLEEVSYYFPHKVMWRAFFAALTAAFTLKLMNPYFSGHLVLFYANYDHQWHLFEFLPFMLIGVFGGLHGALFIWLNIKWSKLRMKLLKSFPLPIVEVVFVAALTGLIQFPNKYTRINASEVIRQLFSQCGPLDTTSIDLCDYNISNLDPNSLYHDSLALNGVWTAVWQLFLAMIVKGLLTVFTYGMKVPAGLFIPSMFVGACMGRIVGICVEQLVYKYQDTTFIRLFCSDQDACITPGLYAMIGAAASLGGVTRMTVSLVVIMFELTGGLTYIVPIMVAVMISKWVGDALVKDGIYDAHIHLLGYPFLDSKEEFTQNTVASDAMKPRQGDPPLTVIDLSTVTIGSLRQTIEESEFFGFPCVLNADSQLLAGFLTRRDIQFVLDQVAVRDEGIRDESKVYFIDSARKLNSQLLETDAPSVNFRGLMDPSPFQISDQTPMETVVEMVRKMGIRQVLISHNGRLLGIITKKDVLRHIALLENKDPSTIRFH